MAFRYVKRLVKLVNLVIRNLVTPHLVNLLVNLVNRWSRLGSRSWGSRSWHRWLRRLGMGILVCSLVGPSLGSASFSSASLTSASQEAPSPSAQPLAVVPVLRPLDWSLFRAASSQAGFDDRLWGRSSDRAALIAAIDHSLDYLQTEAAATAYRNYPVPGFTLERVRQSLERFRQLVLTSPSSEALGSAMEREFALYQSVGFDGAGTVSFTGYFEPIHTASRTPTSEFRYPLYGLPPDLKQWRKPHPTRSDLEGEDGLQSHRGPLQGLEIAWLRDRLEAFLVQVQGSARLQMTDGSTLSVGYAGRTDYPYTSIGQELIQAGKIAAADLTLEAVIRYFQQHPADLNLYLPRNNRFIFFKVTTGLPAIGSLRVPVTVERSIATDKTLMPPGALALIQTNLPHLDTQGTVTSTPVTRYVLDQDTGGAIRGAGRVDLFMGTGDTAGQRAGLINHTGQLYYLLLKP